MRAELFRTTVGGQWRGVAETRPWRLLRRQLRRWRGLLLDLAGGGCRLFLYFVRPRKSTLMEYLFGKYSGAYAHVRVHRLGNIIEINHQKLKKANKTYDRYTVPFEHTPAPYVCFLVGVEPEAS